MSVLWPAGGAGGRRPGQGQGCKQGGQRCTITSVHRPLEGAWSCGVTEPRRRHVLSSPTSVSGTAEGGPLAVSTVLSLNLQPFPISLRQTLLPTPTFNNPSCDAMLPSIFHPAFLHSKKALPNDAVSLPPTPTSPQSIPRRCPVPSLHQDHCPQSHGDLHVATSGRHLQPHPPAKGHVRLSRTLRYLWVENFVVGTLTVSLS